MQRSPRFVLALIGVFLVMPQVGAFAHTDVTVAQAQDLIGSLDDLIVVDVRESYEYCDAVGHIPGAVNYPWNSGVLEARYEELPIDTPILVVCRSGGRSNRAANFLDSMGFAEVYDIMGGMNAWTGDTAPCKYSGGSGTADDPYEIATAEDLMLLGETPDDYDKHFILTADIDLDPNLPGGKVFDKAVIAPDVDEVEDGLQQTPFTGVFDGDHHMISNLVITGDIYLGLFGSLGSEAIVSNLGLEAVDVNGTSDFVGGLAGFNEGHIAQSHSTGTVVGDDDVGGLVGINVGSIANSYNGSTVGGNDRVGGLVGSNGGVIAMSYSSGSVIGHPGDGPVGGLVGEDGGIITMSFWDLETSGLSIEGDKSGKTTTEMQSAGTFLDAGWDFVGETDNGPNDVWKIWDGYDYPRLAYEPGPNTPLVFVDINDPGFSGQMSQYEVTNAQYCDFLNAALASGDITITGADVEGMSGSNSGEDYIGRRYYRGDGSGYTGYGAINGGAARIHYSDGAFLVDSGFANHPVTYVSWYGAMAFANYYGYYLPTEEQWHAVADYDGTYIYGCGETLDPGMANYRDSDHPDGTMPVGNFGPYGYGMSDMAGNVWEWTSSGSDSSRIFRGGSLGSVASDCAISIRGDGVPYANYWDIGFRVCR